MVGPIDSACRALHLDPSILVRPILAKIEGKRAVPIFIRACHLMVAVLTGSDR